MSFRKKVLLATLLGTIFFGTTAYILHPSFHQLAGGEVTFVNQFRPTGKISFDVGAFIEDVDSRACNVTCDFTMGEEVDSTNKWVYKSVTSSDATQEDSFWYFNFVLPTDFSDWPSGDTALSIYTWKSGGAAPFKISLFKDTTVDPTINDFDIIPSANSTWEQKTKTPTGTYQPGDRMTIKIKVSSRNSNAIQFAYPTLTYLRKN